MAASNSAVSSQDRTAAMRQLTELARTSPDVRQWLRGVTEEPGMHDSLTGVALRVLSTTGEASSSGHEENQDSNGHINEHYMSASEKASSVQGTHPRKHAHAGR